MVIQKTLDRNKRYPPDGLPGTCNKKNCRRPGVIWVEEWFLCQDDAQRYKYLTKRGYDKKRIHSRMSLSPLKKIRSLGFPSTLK